MELKELIQNAALAAREEGIDHGNKEQLVAWIRSNCNYRPDTEFFVYFLVCAEMADLSVQAEGYKNQFHRAAVLAKQKIATRKEQERKDNLARFHEYYRS